MKPFKRTKKHASAKLFIATPTYGAAVKMQYTMCLLNTCFLLASKGIPFDVKFLAGSLVTKERNILTGQFIASDATHMLCIDADIKWDPHDVLKLISHGKDMVCGMYPKKMYPIEFPINWAVGNGTMIRDGCLVEIINCGAGFMLISLAALEKMIDAAKETEHVLPLADGKTVRCWQLWDTWIEDGKLYGEDQGFMELWRRCGGKVWLDPEIKLQHIGDHVYSGDVHSITTVR